MDEIDFGGGGDGSSVSIIGDFGSDPSLYSPGSSGFNLPDFGGSAEAPAALNQQFLTQLPNLTSGDFGSSSNAPVFAGESQKLIEQQQSISKATQDLINQQPQIKNSYQQYQQAYSTNLPLYNQYMKAYSGFLNAYNFNMQQGYGDVGNMGRSASAALKRAEEYKQKISDAAKTYTTIVNDYNTNLENVKKSLTDYQANYEKFQNEVTNSKAASQTPSTGTSDTTTPAVPGSGDVNIPTTPPAPPVPETPVATAPDIVVTPPKDVAPVDKPVLQPTEQPIEQPVEEPVDKTVRDTTKPSDPTKSPSTDISINFNPLFPPEKGTLPKRGGLSNALGTDTLSSTLLGSSLASTPSSADPYLLGSDEKARNVWNTESLRNALGI
jgi:hypothetical protein